MSITNRLELLFDDYAVMQAYSGTMLVALDGEPVIRKACGSADVRLQLANQIDTKYYIASITKPMTAVAVMMLAESGLIDPQASCLRYLPAGACVDGRITVHQLLTHTSGIPDFETMPGFDEHAGTPHSNEEMIGLVRHLLPDFEPGQGWKYSNTGYNLLGWMIEHVSGMAYDAFMERHMFAPLGMLNTGGSRSLTSPSGLAAGYTGIAEQTTVVPTEAPSFSPENFKASGNLYSTADDLLLWERALHEGCLVSASYLQRLFTPYAEVNPNRSYGYGFSVYHNGSRGHNGWLPGYWSRYRHFTKQRMTVIMLSNRDYTKECELLDRTCLLFENR